MKFIMKHIPNLLTAIRFLLVPILIYLLYFGHFLAALYLIIFMGLSDALDGFVAKKLNCVSRFGGFFDSICDKMMLIAAAVMLAYIGLLPIWLVWLIIARDLIIVIGGSAYYFYIEEFLAKPSIISKANTFFQLLLIVIVIYSQIGIVPQQWIDGLITIVATTTLLSGIGYIWTWGRNALKACN